MSNTDYRISAPSPTPSVIVTPPSDQKLKFADVNLNQNNQNKR